MVADEKRAGHRGGGDGEVLKDEGEGKESDDEGAAERGEAIEAGFLFLLFWRGCRCFAHRFPPVTREVYRNSCDARRVGLYAVA